MSLLFCRTATIPVWLVVFALVALSASPMTFAAGAVLLAAGATLALMLMKARRPTIASMLPAPLAMLPSPAVVPNSWPNSGFRNISQRGTMGR